MKNPLPFLPRLHKRLRQALKAAAFLVIIVSGSSLQAAGKPFYPRGGNISCPADALKRAGKNIIAPPVINYTTPQSFTAGTAISTLSPTSSGVDAAGYSSSGVTIGSGFSNPQGVAVDAAGNIYIADTGNNRVVKIPAGGGTTTTIGSGYSAPICIAVDEAGVNMYVAEENNDRIKKVAISDGSITSWGIGAQTTGLTVDAVGNLFVLFIYPTESVAGVSVIYPNNAGGRTFGLNELHNPTGIAIDVAGNIFITDSGNNTLTEVPFQGGKPVTLASGFNQPTGVNLDASGNIFVTESGDDAVKEIPVGSSTPVNIGGGFSSPAALAVGPAGIVYIADAGNNAVKQLNPVGGYYLSAALPAGLGFNNSTGVISGTPLSYSPATNYTVTAYNATGSSQAVINIKVKLPPFPTVSYSGPQAYTVGKAISPLLPSGSGTAAPGFSTAYNNYDGGIDLSMAFDAAGNFYEGHSARVTEIPAGGGSSTLVGPTNLYSLFGMAVDPAGDVFVTFGPNTNAVKEIPIGPGVRDTVTIAGGFNAPQGIAIDGAGNLYVADSGTGSIKKIAAAGRAVTTIISGLTNPQTPVIDMQGNLYVTEYSPNNDVKEFPANGGAPVVLASGLNQPTGLTVDPGGNVYFSDFDNEVKRIPAGGGTAVKIGSGYNDPNALAFDATGRLFVSDYGAPQDVNFIKPVGGYFISPNLPPGLSFNSATGAISGTPTTASASTVYSISGWNVSGKTTATVTISVKAPDATLSLLKVKGYALSPAFAPAVTSYAVTVANNVASVILTPTTNDAAATVKINGTTVASGAESPPITLAVGANTINTVVTAFDGSTTKTYTVTVTRAAANANLAKLTVSGGTVLSPAFTPATTSYTSTVPNTVSGVTVTPSASAATSTIKVNGTTVASGSASPTIPLSVGNNTITTIVTAGDGSTTKTYTVVITRQAPGANATLSGLTISAGVLTPVFSPTKTSYTAAESNGHSSITLTPTTSDPEATVKVNGVSVTSGTASGAIPLAVGPNTINVVVTGHDGSTTETYTLTATRAPSTNDNLARLVISEGAVLSPAFSPATTSYTASVIEGVSSVTVTPTASDGTASITVNGGAVASGSPSGNIPLAIGPNTISTVVTAQDGSTTKTYTVTVTRESGGADSYVPVSVTKPGETPVLAEDGILVHQGISPNGDGINDFLQIDNISQYPDNKLSIMDRNGQLIFETKGYDNSSKLFDGHSNKTGQMQLPGTYFYQLDYTVSGVTKHKTGFIVLKY